MSKIFGNCIILLFITVILLSSCTIAFYNPFHESSADAINEVLNKDTVQNEVPDDGKPDNEIPDKEDEDEIGAVALTIESDNMTVSNQKNIILTFSFSEAVKGFDKLDIHVEGANLIDFEGNGALYKVEISFLKDGTASVFVDAGSAKDAKTGLKESEPALLSIMYDGTAPQIMLKGPFEENTIVGHEHYLFTVEFSEKINGFELSDITSVNARITDFNKSETNYSFIVAPIADGLVTLEIPANSITDLAGNNNNTVTSFSFTYDTDKIATNISSPSEIITNQSPLTLSVSFGAAITGPDFFELSDIIINAGNANVTNLTGSGKDYTFMLTPLADGEIIVSIPDSAVKTHEGFTNSTASYSFIYDSKVPAPVLFDLDEWSGGEPISSNDISNEFLKLTLTTDYSGDSGTGLTYEYTTDNGVTWEPFTNPQAISDNNVFAGINIRVTDETGNRSIGTALTNITVDTLTPAAPTVQINPNPINAGNADNVVLTLNGEVGNTFNYTIGSSGGGVPISSSSTFDADGNASLTIDFTQLNDGEIIIEVTQTDEAGNTSPAGGPSVSSVIYDGTNPAFTLNAPFAEDGVVGHDQYIFIVTFTEQIDGFEPVDIKPVNAEISDFNATGTEYSFKVTPVAAGAVSLEIPANCVTDLAGNGNLAGDTFNFTYDASKIAVTISSSTGTITNDSPVTMSVSFGTTISGSDIFELSDITIDSGNADVSDLSGSGKDYTFTLSPLADGVISVSIPDSCIKTTAGFTNGPAAYSFTYDSTAPATVLFELNKSVSGEVVTSNDISDELLTLTLTTDYSSDGGTALIYEYTTDNGITWASFTNPETMSDNGVYTGINIRVTDAAGNRSTGTALTNIAIDTIAPAAPTATISHDPINAHNADNVVLTLNGEAGNTFNGKISSSGGGTPISNSGFFDADGNAGFSLDLSQLNDGEITIEVTQTDKAGNSSPYESASVLSITYDTIEPEFILNTPFVEETSVGYGHYVFAVDFSEETEGFTLTDINVVNADISDFSATGTEYSFKVTPVAAGAVSLEIPANCVTDLAGNGNLAGDIFNFTYDASKIAVTISSSTGTITNDSPITMSVTFDKALDGPDYFELSDITIDGGNADVSGLSGSGKDYTFTLSPLADGVISVLIPDSCIKTTAGFTNGPAAYSFTYDSTAPATVLFELNKSVSGEVVTSNDISDELLTLTLTTDYSGDGGTALIYEYTTDNGITWASFTNPETMSNNGVYTGINIRVTDAAGNRSTGTALTNIAIDTIAPAAPTATISHDPINAHNADNVVLTLNGEAGNAFNVKISSSGDSDTIDLSAAFDNDGKVILTPDIASLNDGLITVEFYQTDGAGNVGQKENITVTMNRTIPSVPALTVTSGSILTKTNTTLALELQGAANYKYTLIFKDESEVQVYSETNTFDSSGNKIYSDFDYSSLPQGVLTLSLTQSDVYGNTSSSAIDTITYDSIINNYFEFNSAINKSNESNITLELGGDAGDSYSYGITSSNGGAPISGSGVFDASGEEDITGLDVSGLGDGYLIMVVDVTDAMGNVNQVREIVEKDTASDPVTTPADFSDETTGISFDPTYQGNQTVDSGVVRYDTDEVTGTEHDDVFKFADLEDGDVYTINGGEGYNAIDLSKHLAGSISISTGETGENDGAITITLPDGGTATINFTDIEHFEFDKNVFDGSPHSISIDTDNSTDWVFNGKRIEVVNTDENYLPAVIQYEGTIALNFILDIMVHPVSSADWKNGSLIFDYVDENNFKFVAAYAGNDTWRIGETIDGINNFYVMVDEEILEDVDNYIQLRVTGAEGKTAELWANGVKKGEYTFDDILNDGSIGLSNRNAYTIFELNMGPSNWTPYLENFDVKYYHQFNTEITLDLLKNAVDAEGDPLVITDISSPLNGTLSDNGDNTITYKPNDLYLGIETLTYTVSDGINTVTGHIRIDIMP